MRWAQPTATLATIRDAAPLAQGVLVIPFSDEWKR
jgi:hypothetical protein